MKKKSIAVVLALVLLVCCAVGGVLAWLTATTGPVVNTFTVGNVDITLAESVDTDSDGAASFKMVPGQTIFKDPKVTVVGGSEACWLFVKVEKSTNLDDFITYAIATGDNGWTQGDGTKIPANVYYRAVSAATTGQEFNVLTGNQVTVKDTVTKDMMDDINDGTAPKPTLTFTAYACQSAGFETAAAAWTANFAS